MRLDARFREENPRARLPDRDHFIGRSERGKTAAHLGCVEHFVVEAMYLGTPLRARDDRAVGPADHQTAGSSKEPLSSILLQIRPKFVGALDERHVKRILEIGFADDARLPVRRTQSVRRVEAVQAERFLSAPGQMACRRAAHRAQADNDDIECGSHFIYPRICANPFIRGDSRYSRISSWFSPTV